MSSAVLLDHPRPHVARLLINRPDKRNAIDHSVRQAMIEALSALDRDPQTRALVIGGVGGVFSAGGDLASMSGLSEDQARARMQHVHVLCRLLAATRIPVVSAIEGVGAGAAVGLALLGDYIVAGAGARILFPFLSLGLTPDWGELFTLPQRVGLPVARRILTSGDPVDGPEALRIGLIDELAADAEVMQAAIAKAVEFSRLPMEAFARMKQRLRSGSRSIGDELAREEADQVACLLGVDFAEGYDAFKTKRAPDFIRHPGTRR